MGKRGGLYIVVAAVMAVGLAAAASGGTVTIDGDISSDWGVNLQLYNTGDTINGVAGTRFVADSFVPSVSGIVGHVSNDDVPISHGGEPFDVEAMYCTVDDDYVYFAIVTSASPRGTRWDGYGDCRFGPGDLKVTVDGNGGGETVYGIGARPIDLTTSGLIGYGPTDQRGAVTWDSATDVGGTHTYYTTSQARVESGPTWSYVDNPGCDIDAYFVGGSGAYLGYADAAWKRWAAVGDYYEDDPYGKDEPYGTWIYEVGVQRSLMSLTSGTDLDLSFFATDCGNDAIALLIPEPVSMVFFGTGVVGVLGFVARRRMRRS